MFFIQKEQNDIFVTNSMDNSIKFLNDDEKEIVFNILPQLTDPLTRSVVVNEIPDELSCRKYA